ncbi:MAG: carbohydrate porin, partial [Opitutus sp.]|nr:carbohydrate porin [Opitutus sp.]
RSSGASARSREANSEILSLIYAIKHELSYTIVLNDHLSLQPDLQYIRHPASDSTRDNALMFLLRLSASY